MKKYLLSSICMLALSTPALAQDYEPGTGLSILIDTIDDMGAKLDYSWDSSQFDYNSEKYKNVVFTIDGSSMTINDFEIKENSGGTFYYKMEGLESSNDEETLKADVAIISTHPKELLSLISDMENVGLDCHSNNIKSRMQLMNFSLVSNNEDFRFGMADLSFQPILDNGSCMLDAAYSLQDISFVSNDVFVNLRNVSGDMYTSADYKIPTVTLSKDLYSNFTLSDLSFGFEPNSVFGGIQSIKASGSNDSASMLRLASSKINLLIEDIYAKDQLSNQESVYDPNYPLNLLDNPNADLAEIWNGFKEVVGNSNIQLSNAYISKSALIENGIPIPQSLLNTSNDYLKLSGNMDFVKTNGGLDISMGIDSPDILSFDVGIGLGMGEVSSMPVDVNMALLTLPIGITNVSASFKDSGIDAAMKEVTGVGIKDNAANVINHPMANILPSNGQLILNWISSGLNGSTAYFSMNSNNPVPFMMMVPIAMGDWSNATSLFSVQSSVE